MISFSFPSKTFLLGEYAVLRGPIQALLLAHPPLFEATFMPGHAMEAPFHPESPAGRWLAAHPVKGKIAFLDAHQGRGGFGGSGAEFLSAFASYNHSLALDPRSFAWAAWQESRPFPGSGADIVTQAYGMNRKDAFILKLDLSAKVLSERPLPSNGTLSLFHTGKKLATHENLAPPADFPWAELAEIAQAATCALEAGNFAELATSLGAYGDRLRALGLLAPHSARALHALRGQRGVLAAKGCGAMGADVILVAHQNASLQGWAEENSLAWVGNFPV